MRYHCLKHVPFEGPGAIRQYALAHGIVMSGTDVFNEEPFPSPDDFDALFVMGGPMSANDENIHSWLKPEKRFIEDCIKSGKKVAGICLGAQLIADVLGARIKKNRHREIGWFDVKNLGEPGAFPAGIPGVFSAFHWHGETFDIPAGAVRAAQNEACTNQAFFYGENVLALQFHLECTEESICGLISNCGEELKEGGSYVQPAEALIKEEMIASSNSLMELILKDFA